MRTVRCLTGRRLKPSRAKLKLFILVLLFVIPNIYFMVKYMRIHGVPRLLTFNLFTVKKTLVSPDSITRIENTEHLAVSAFVDHRLNGAIRVISIIKQAHKQPLFCFYGDGDTWHVSKAELEIHSDHFDFPFAVSDLLCHGKFTQEATLVYISTHAKFSTPRNGTLLKVKNRVKRDHAFGVNFTVCVSNLFGRYNNVLQYVQTLEMYKLLGVQRVIIYNTSCGPDLEKLLQHYQHQGFLEIVSWPIDHFLKPSPGWNFTIHGGDLHYYGQLVTLNECIYRNMYRSRFLLLNDIDEIIMPYKYQDLSVLMNDLQQEHQNVGVFYIENHIFPKTRFDQNTKFHLKEWENVPGINIMEHIYREPDRKDVFNPKKFILNPRMVFQTSVHSVLNYTGHEYEVPFNVCRIVHVRTPLQDNLTQGELMVDTRVWDFQHKLVPNVNRVLLESQVESTSETHGKDLNRGIDSL